MGIAAVEFCGNASKVPFGHKTRAIFVPPFTVAAMSWSTNWPNCMSICECLASSDLFLCPWKVALIVRALGRPEVYPVCGEYDHAPRGR